MKKHLIAAAVAAAVAVPAMAQVTMSGRIDTSVGVAKNSTSVQTTRMTSSVLTTNQIVFSGSEDLGGGLKANFNMSSGFASDASNGVATTTRNSVGTFVLGDRGMQVGVSGGFGALDIGRTTGTMLNSTSASGLTGNIGNLTVFNARPDNSISFTSPTVSGFTGRIVYGVGDENNTRALENQLTEGSVQYSAGPLLVRGAYSTIRNAVRVVTVAASTDIFGQTTAAGAVALADRKITETGVQVDYNLGMARVNFRYQTRAHDAPVTANVNDTAIDFSQMGIGAAVPFGATTLSADYATTDSKRLDGSGDVRIMSLTAVNALSKRTNAYAAYASRASAQEAAPPARTLFAVGVRHSF